MYERILVGTDGSATAATAVDRAVEVAVATGAELTILCVGDGERARSVVDAEAVRHASSGAHLTTRTASGDPSSVLIDVAAQDGFDLIVVGNKGMTGARRIFLGSVPNKVSHHAPVSLLIVRTT